MSILTLKFKGIDDYNRPVYKAKTLNGLPLTASRYYGSVYTLFPDKSIAPNNTPAEINAYFREHIEELEYFGVTFNCEPNGGKHKLIKLIIED